MVVLAYIILFIALYLLLTAIVLLPIGFILFIIKMFFPKNKVILEIIDFYISILFKVAFFYSKKN